MGDTPAEDEAAPQPMTYEEKRRLCQDITNLAPENLSEVVRIIQLHTQPAANDDDGEIEIDIEMLPPAAHRHLKRFAPADVWHAANSGSFVGDGSTAQNWERVASLLRGWPQFVTGPTAKDWFPLLPRLRSVLVSPSSSQGQGHKDDATAAAVSHEPAAALLRQVVAAALREGASSLVVTGAGEVYRENVTRLLSSATPACGGVLEVLLALFTQEESEAVVGSAAQTLGAVAEAVSADDQLKRELLVAPSTLLKAVKQLVRKLGQLAGKPDHSSRLADVVEGAMICLRALSGTVRAQCANVEAACIHLLDSPHAAVRKAVAECMSVRPWCSGMDEWSGLVGATISTIHYHINSNYPPAPGVRQGLPAPFQLPGRSYTGGSVALERRLSTLFTTLRHCLGAPPTNQPARAVPVPIPHLLDLIARVVALSPVSAHFDSPNRTKLGLWTILPTLHAHAYRLLSSLTVCVGRHLLPHYAAVLRLFVHGLERSSQEQSVAWTRPLHCLLESIGFAFPVLASCLWKDGATSILSQVLPLLSAQHVAQNATQRALQLSAMKVVGAVVRHAGPVLTDLHAIEIHHTVLNAAAKPVSLAFQEETRRVLADLCLLPQTAPLLPGTLRVLQHDAHAQSIASSSSAASASAVAVSELLIHPRVLPRVRLAPPPLPTPAAVLASVPLTAPTVVPVPVHTPWAVEELNSAKRKTVDDDDRMVITHEPQLSQPSAITTTTILSAVTAPSPKRARTEELAAPLSATNTSTSSSSSSSTVQQPPPVSVTVSASAVLPAALPEPEPERVTPVVSVFAAPTAATQVTTALPTFSTLASHGADEDATEEMADIIADGPDSSDEEGDAEEDVGAEDEDEDEEDEDEEI